MEGIPVCEWDASLGWVFVRFGDLLESSEITPAWIVVEPVSGRPYIGARLAPRQLRTIVKAPVNGDFTLAFYNASIPKDLLGKKNSTQARVSFSSEVVYEDSKPVDADYQVEFSVLASVRHKRVLAKRATSRVLNPGDLPREVLVELLQKVKTQPGVENANVTATSIYRETRGPCEDANLDNRRSMDTLFTLVHERLPDNPEWLQLKGFTQLKAPSVNVDLSHFGESLDPLLKGIAFIRVPFNDGINEAEIDTQHNPGRNQIKLFKDKNGKKILRCIWMNACHRDLLGVYFSGGPYLSGRDISGQLQKQLNHGLSDVIMTCFLGEQFRAEFVVFDQISDRVKNNVSPFHVSQVDLAAVRAWATGDEALQVVGSDLTGAEDASPAFIFSYVSWIHELAPFIAIGNGIGHQLEDPLTYRDKVVSELQRLNLDVTNFRKYKVLADIVWTLSWHDGIRQQLIDRWADFAKHLAYGNAREYNLNLVARLVLAYSDDLEVANWVEQMDPPEQVAVLRYMEQGILLHNLFRAGVRPDAEISDSRKLNDALGLLFENRERYELVSATLKDLGYSIIEYGAKGVNISQVLEVGSQVEKAETALETECQNIETFFKRMEIVSGNKHDALGLLKRHLQDVSNLDDDAEQYDLARRMDDLLSELRVQREETKELTSLRTRAAQLLVIQTLDVQRELRKFSRPLMEWCGRLLEGDPDYTWHGKDVEMESAIQTGIMNRLQAFRDSVSVSPSLYRVERFSEPQWQEERYDKWDKFRSGITKACSDARRWLQRSDLGDEERMNTATKVANQVVSTIETVENLAGWFASRMLWGEVNQRLQELIEQVPSMTPELHRLQSRVTAPLDEWDRVAEQVEALDRQMNNRT